METGDKLVTLDGLKAVYGVIDDDISDVKSSFQTLTSKNLFNINSDENYFGTNRNDCYRLTVAGLIYHETGGMDAVYSVSHFISVEDGKTVYFSANNGLTGVFQLACYDENKTIIGSLYNWKTEFNIPSGTKYIRFSSSQLTNNFQCEYNARTSYEPYFEYNVMNLNVYDSKIIYDEIIDVMPRTIYGVQNMIFDMYFKNVIIGNFDRWIIKSTGAGSQLSRCIRFNSSVAGTNNIIVSVKANNYNDVITKPISYVNANSNTHNDQTLKVLVIGDSFINSGYVTQGLINDFDNDVANITLLGTMGTSPNLYEGRSGWSTYDYVHTSSYNNFTNPFLNNGVFDFSYYISNNGIDTPDYVIINLGINDTHRPMNNTTTSENLITMINSIKSYNSNIKILVGTTPPPYLGEGANGYLCNLDENKKRQNITLNVITNINNIQNVFVVPTHCVLDTDYNFRMGTIVKNKYNSETVPFCEDTTHPLAGGFYQIADAYYAAIKAT